MNRLAKLFGQQTDLFLVVAMLGILVVLFTPIPPQLLDFLLISNFTFAILLLLLAFYMKKPLDFSTFPSLLLIATLFRLSLNISATRLILSDADGGEVINSIGTYLVGGNYVIGLIVFIVLIVVQYVVVTNGAQRVAEVAARFTLDSMPGKQLSIDADLNIGVIDEQEAQKRRKDIEREGSFYGSMDGASKFVKGDAIAGIIIILIDIIGGLIIGVAMMSMSWDQSLQTFTLLTIGDGIVTQIPALIIATSTGIIVTRASSDDYLSKEIARQITAYPKTLLLVGICLFLFMLLPGMPVTPIFIVMMIVATLTYFVFKSRGAELAEETIEEPEEDDLYGMLAVDPVEIAIGQNLVSMVGGDDSIFMDRIATFRKQYALDMGFVIPKIRIKDDRKLAPNTYVISVYGAKVGNGELLADRLLAINPGNATNELEGITTKDPSYGLPATWIIEELRKEARDKHYTVVEPSFVLMTHLSEAIKRESDSLLTRAETERLIERIRQTQSGLVDELIPNVMTLSEVQKVLQILLKERVSIRNIESILEVLVDAGKQIKEPDVLAEMVRHKLGSVICQSLLNRDGDLFVLTLDPSIEQTIVSSVRKINDRNTMVLEPKFAEQLLSRTMGQVEKMMKSNHVPVLLTAPELRSQIRNFTERLLPHLAILSLAEVPNNINVKSYGMVSV